MANSNSSDSEDSHARQGTSIEEQEPKFQLGLLENGLDFVLSAAEHADAGTPRDLKYAALHLVDGIELLIKARLEKEHWTLLFADTDRASQTKLRQGDFRSVDLPMAIERLKNIVGIQIGTEREERLNEIRNLRNRLRHYKADLGIEQVRALLAVCLDFCYSFFRDDGNSLPGNISNEATWAKILNHLRTNKEFVEARLENIRGGLIGSRTWECSECWQHAVVIDADDTNCKFCGVVPNPITLAIHNAADIDWKTSDENGGLPWCEECEEGLIVHLPGQSGEERIYMCSFCGEYGERLLYCLRCDEPTGFAKNGEEERFCHSCIEFIRTQ